MPRTLCLLPFAMLLCAAVATAQDPEPPPKFPSASAPNEAQTSGVATLQLSTRIVVLDVVITDKKGNLYTGPALRKDDFTILEDKAPQTIRSFEAPAAHVQPAGVVVSSAADLKKIGEAPVTILVLDELNTRFEDMAFQRQSMVKFLKAQAAVLPQPTELLVANNTRFVELHDYTQSRDDLIAAINHHMPQIPSKLQAGRGGAMAVERMAQSLASLEQIAQASSGTPGRKNVIWVGNGFPSADTVSLDPQTAAVILGAVQQCTNMLLSARITMYTVNPVENTTTTVQVDTPDDLDNAELETGGEPFGGGVQFSTFAPATGGRAFLSRNDLNNEILEGIDAGATYYTLSYNPTNRADAEQKYRSIRILLKDKNLRATTRDGYYPPNAATRNIALTEKPKQAKAQLELDLSSAVNSTISYNGLDVKALPQGSGYLLVVKAAGLDWKNVNTERDRAEATTLAAWYDVRGKLLGHAGQELTADLPASSEAVHPGSAAFTLPLPALPADAVRLRLIVRDASSGHMGTVDVKPQK